MANPKTRGRKPGRGALMMVGMLLVGAAAAVGTILVLGDVKLPFLNRSVQAQASKKTEDRTGKVAVPILVRTVAAYTSVPKTSLIDPKTQQFVVKWLDAEAVKEKGFVTDVNEILGRVMSRDKEPGYAFKESDFLPKGTRPGPAAGIEPGMRGMSVSVDKIAGLRGLKRGDRFDLMAAKSATKAGGSHGDKSNMSPAAAAARADQQLWGASNKVLVQNGKIVVPFPIPGQEGARGKNAEVYIQVADSEVDPLTEALAVGAELTCALRSGLPGAGATPLPLADAPAEESAPPVQSIEVINAGKSSLHIVEGSKADAEMLDDTASDHADDTSAVQPPKKEPHK
ncbi:MAG: hypothetical protein ACKVWV_10055 [Planctomycetota bacterium]